MKLAAIDIGSNAIRLLIKDLITGHKGIKHHKILLLRVPLRLGEDVFSIGRISEEKQLKLIEVMQAFKLLMKANDVVEYKACATSAMREANNGEEVRDLVNSESGVFIDLISGDEEAELIFSNWKLTGLSNHKSYFYVDVGGGSTEITLLRNGKRVQSCSFKIGAVRMLESKIDQTVWDEAKQFIEEITKEEKDVIAVGSGGNITKIFKESNRDSSDYITYKEIEKIVQSIASLDFENRIEKFKLKPNRADVIIPAGKIYLFVMKSGGADKMLVPKMGVSDGIINRLALKVNGCY